MARIDVRMPSGEGIAAGQTATFKLPIGRRYHRLELECAATTFQVSDLTEVRVLVNGQVIQRFSGAQRNTMNLFDGRQDAVIDATSFNLVIPFDRYKLNTLAGEEETAINTGSTDPKSNQQITSLNVEVDVTATGNLTGTPTMLMTAQQSEALPGGPGTLMYIQRFNRALAGASQGDSIADLPKGTAASIALNRMFIQLSANAVTRVQLLRNQYIIFDRKTATNQRAQADGYRVPQNGWFVIDRTENALGGDPIDLVGAADMQYIIFASGAATATVLAEYLGAMAG